MNKQAIIYGFDSLTTKTEIYGNTTVMVMMLVVVMMIICDNGGVMVKMIMLMVVWMGWDGMCCDCDGGADDN